MSNLDSQLLTQAGAVVGLGTTGAALLRIAAPRTEDALIAVGLLVAAGLTAVDAMAGGAHALPLAGWALLLFAGIGLGRCQGPVASALIADRGRLAAAGVVAAMLLHWAHTAMPLQPALHWGVAWYGLDLTCGAALAWLVWARPTAPFERRFLLAAVALGLGTTSFAGSQAATLAAGLQAIGTVPWLLRTLSADLRSVTIAAAATFAVATACAVRGHVLNDGLTLDLPGLDDPLLLIATLFALFGIALLGTTIAKPLPDVPLPDVHEPATAAGAPATAPSTPDSPPLSTPTPVVAKPAITMRDLAHGLRKPLTSMLATADLLANTTGEVAALTTLRRHGRQLADMLGHLEEHERLRSGGVQFACDSYDFHRAVHDAVRAIAPLLQEHGAITHVDIAAETPRWVLGDPPRVADLLARMLAAGAIDCTLHPLEVTAGADATRLHVVVRNHDTSEHPLVPLDVLLCQEIAACMGGELTYRVHDGGGIELHLALEQQLAPGWEIELMREDEPCTAAPAAAADSAAAVRGKVLLVDDSRDHQRLIGHLLTRAGAEVTIAASGDVALQLLAATTFDLVLLDMQMPGKDGYDTVAEMRTRGLVVPVVAVTAASSPTDVERCLAAGCNSHLAKPLDTAALRQALAMHLPTAAT